MSMGLSVCPWFWEHNQHPLWTGVRTLPWAGADWSVGADGQLTPWGRARAAQVSGA